MVSEIGFGIIGCGSQGKVLGGALAGIKGAKIVAVADVNEVAAKKAVEELNIEKYYTDYHDLLERREVDAVIVAVPHTLLKSVSIDVAKAGKHVFVEKPMGINRFEGKEVINACRKAGIKLMVGYCLRFNSTTRRMKELIEGGAVGEVNLVTGIRENLSSHWARWLLDPNTGGGILLYLGSHLIDEVLWMEESEVERVCGEVNTNPDLGVDETVVFSMRFKSGVLANLSLSMASTRMVHRVSVVGSEGTVTSDPFEGSLEIYSKKSREYAYPTSLKILDDPNRSMYTLELEDFVKSIVENTETSITGEAGLKVLEVIDAVFESSKTGKSVRLIFH